jgi:GNAT superfamily N-acetyltransferase
VSGSSDVEVRTATADDLDGLLALYTELAGDRVGAEPADRVDGARIFAEILTFPGRELLVAVAPDGQLVGTVDGVIVANLTRRGRPWAVVENVVVAADARRTGVGSRLFDELRRRAVAAGCYKLQLLSRKQRVEAHAFYASVGFEAVAEGFRCYLD